jgi:polyketide cyclase/dehydrase/lipid transport protein
MVAGKRPRPAVVGGGTAGGLCHAIHREVSIMKRSIHIEAPVEKVFDFFKDPKTAYEAAAMPFAINDVKLTEEGVGTYYSWATKTPVLRWEGFDVYTEVIPNQRITDRSSSPSAGDSTLSFEPEGSGMKLTIETRQRSFWRIPPLRELVDLVQSTGGERLLSAVKAKMEA